jgi:hypothetical protein
MHRLTSKRWADENTMVLSLRYVVPPDAYRGEERVSLKPPKFTPMSRVRKTFDVCQIQGFHGEGTVGQITSCHLFEYFLSIRCQVSNAR